MKKGKHSTPKDETSGVWEFNEGEGASRKFDLEDRLLEFASAVIDLSESLPATRSGNHIAGQAIRSGTSPYSNHAEAEAAESHDDVIYKLKICLKELRETPRWARLIKRKGWVNNETTLFSMLGEPEGLIQIFHSSIQTAKRNAIMEASKPSNRVRYPASKAG